MRSEKFSEMSKGEGGAPKAWKNNLKKTRVLICQRIKRVEMGVAQGTEPFTSLIGRHRRDAEKGKDLSTEHT